MFQSVMPKQRTGKVASRGIPPVDPHLQLRIPDLIDTEQEH